ncbi:hypothetical protein AOLI_G00051080 [Acnodon oligacanthus]
MFYFPLAVQTALTKRQSRLPQPPPPPPPPSPPAPAHILEFRLEDEGYRSSSPPQGLFQPAPSTLRHRGGGRRPAVPSSRHERLLQPPEAPGAHHSAAQESQPGGDPPACHRLHPGPAAGPGGSADPLEARLGPHASGCAQHRAEGDSGQ